MPQTAQTHAEFTATHGINAKVRRIKRNPMMDADMDHWSVTLTRGEKGVDYAEMRVPFSKGYGHHGEPPTASEVLECLASDSWQFGVTGRAIDFETWCDEYGYDSDSRKALKTFDACKDIAERLVIFLGPDLFVSLGECQS